MTSEQEPWMYNPTLKEIALRDYPAKKEHAVVVEICGILKRKRLKDDYTVDLKRLCAMQRITQEKALEYIAWYEGLLLDCKFVVK
jgi:hypothetical protein